MSRSGRHFLAALAGLAALFTVFGLGVMLGAGSSVSNEQRYQSYRYAADKPLEFTATGPGEANSRDPEYREPCREPKGSSESELCAQWRAANAGENSAFWAQWSFWVSGLSAAGILAALILTINSNKIARSALSVSSTNTQKELRAYIYNMGNSWSFVTIVESGIAYWRGSAVWQNLGNTPAKDVELQIWHYIQDSEMPIDFAFDKYEKPVRIVIAPQGSVNSSHVNVYYEEMIDVYEGRKYLYLWGWCRYNDIFEESPQRLTRFCYRVFVEDNPRLPPSDTNHIRFRTEHWPMHNDAV
jgi:hypothetical protein